MIETIDSDRRSFTSSSRALSSPSVGPLDPRAAGNRLTIPSTSFTCFRTDAAVVGALSGGPTGVVTNKAAAASSGPLGRIVPALAASASYWMGFEESLSNCMREEIVEPLRRPGMAKSRSSWFPVKGFAIKMGGMIVVHTTVIVKPSRHNLGGKRERFMI